LDGDSWILGGLLVLGVALTAFASLAEMALTAVSRSQLRQTLAAGHERAQAAEALLDQPARFVATLLVVKLFSSLVVASAATLLAQRLGRPAAIPWALAGSLVLLLLARLLPKAWSLGRQEQVAPWIAPPLRGLALLLWPVTWLMLRIGQAGTPEGASADNLFMSEDGLRLLLNASEEETMIEDDEKEMIKSIFEFGETLVREVMVPRIDVMAVSLDTSMLEATDVILKAGHSRLPVYDETIDNVTGILYAKDLLHYLRDGRTDVPLSKILRPPYFIPESKKVDELLQELQQRRVHMAVVVDEYGGTAGIVTIEDLLEEIVGEIQDEYDAEQPTIEAVGDDEYLFDARVPLDEVNKLLDVELPAEGGDTLGGFIYSQLGKVPAVSDTIQFDGVTIEVLSVAGRRIKQVRAKRAQAVPEERDGGIVALTIFGLH
jgi:CBS domain containing-hemolysin-like protein